MRTSLIAGNWKMNLDTASAMALVEGLVGAVDEGKAEHCEVAVFPPAVYLAKVAEKAARSAPSTGVADAKRRRLAVGAQNCHYEASGPHTGEVSAPMIRDVGCSMVLVGHSERRHEHGETDAIVRKKLAAALRAGLRPIVCVGETLAERDAGAHFTAVERQVASLLEGGEPELLANVAIAYEPVWAIGTGRNASPAQAAEIHGSIRAAIARRFSRGAADATRILYGGSVTVDNAETLLADPEIDGALVGGASLKLESFLRIVASAKRR